MKLRLLTYNVHKCAGGLDRRRDPERVAAVIAAYRPDVVLLQEVVEARRSGPERQVELLAALLGIPHHAYNGHAERRDGVRYGNAILSRWRIEQSTNVDLTVPLKKKRAALHALVSVQGPGGKRRSLHVFNLHLGLSGIERRFQLVRFLAAGPFAGLHAETPIVVGGDLNDVWGTLGRRLLGPAGFRSAPRRRATFPAFAPLRALDGLFARGAIHVEQVQVCRAPPARSASDHLPVIMDAAIA